MERSQKVRISTIVIVFAAAGLFAGITAPVSMIPEPTDDVGACRVTEALGFTEPRILHRYPGHVAAWQRGCGEDDTSRRRHAGRRCRRPRQGVPRLLRRLRQQRRLFHPQPLTSAHRSRLARAFFVWVIP